MFNQSSCSYYKQIAVNKAVKLLKEYEMEKEQVESFKNELLKMKSAEL
jgi:hypothetical protein